MTFKKRFTDEQINFIKDCYSDLYEYMNTFERGVYAYAIKYKCASDKQREIMKQAYLQCSMSKYPELK